jgi:hypothetical protein
LAAQEESVVSTIRHSAVSRILASLPPREQQRIEGELKHAFHSEGAAPLYHA